MNSMLWNNMMNGNNITETANGDITYKSSLNGLMNLLFKAGVMRKNSLDDIIKVFVDAYSENPLYAIRLLFYNRDVRGGQGCKNFFYKSMYFLMKFKPEVFKACIQYIPEYGSWKDIFILIEYAKEKELTEVFESLMNFVKDQYIKDVSNILEKKSISLLMKWMPSENTSSQNTKELARVVRNYLGINSKTYRKSLSLGRKYLNIVECKLTDKDYLNIDYKNVPSKAMQNYRQAFLRNDEKRFLQYIADVKAGKSKINAKALYPFDIISKLTCKNGFANTWYLEQMDKNELSVLLEQWKALPDFFKGKKDNSIVVADVSGSMEGIPMCVCVSLALYIAQRNHGLYHNKFITFSNNPTLVETTDDLIESMIKLSNAEWDMTTNIDAVFRLIYQSIPPSTIKDIPSTIYIISDMQFNQATSNNNKTLFERWKEKFNKIGLELPRIVFWNVAENDYNNVPITINESGALLISGFNPVILSYIMGNSFNNTLELIKNIVCSERYKNILSKDFKF